MPQTIRTRVAAAGFAIVLALSGIYSLPVSAQEPGGETAFPLFGDGVNTNKPFPGEAPVITEGTGTDSQPANEMPVITEGTGTDSQPANQAPAISEPSGPMSATDKVVARFMALDMDTSGGVSFEEYMTMVQERIVARYAAMDADGNGEVTDNEYRTFWKSRMAQWYRLKR